jgi:hypothetical protein
MTGVMMDCGSNSYATKPGYRMGDCARCKSMQCDLWTNARVPHEAPRTHPSAVDAQALNGLKTSRSPMSRNDRRPTGDDRIDPDIR